MGAQSLGNKCLLPLDWSWAAAREVPAQRDPVEAGGPLSQVGQELMQHVERIRSLRTGAGMGVVFCRLQFSALTHWSLLPALQPAVI